jgi:integrase
LGVLSPIWTEKHETAKRLKQRLGAIFDWAKGAGHYPHENPINGLKKALPSVKRRPEHMSTLGWQRVPEFMVELQNRDGVSARTLEFIILTASRSGEARGARWAEISDGIWTVPAGRMKRGLEHRVPLSHQATHVLEKVRDLDSDLVFPSRSPAKDGSAREQSDMVFKALLKRMGKEGFTVHGFRSAFRDWCSEVLEAPREVAEAALSHALGSSVERAYARSDLLERRVLVMQEWADYACKSRNDFGPAR